MHLDRIIFGTSTSFLLRIPGGQSRDENINLNSVDWLFAQEEKNQNEFKTKKEEEEKYS